MQKEPFKGRLKKQNTRSALIIDGTFAKVCLFELVSLLTMTL